MLSSFVTSGVPSTRWSSARVNHCSVRPFRACSGVGSSSLRRLNSTVGPPVVVVRSSQHRGRVVRSHEDRLPGMSEQTHKAGFETRAIHAGYEPDPTTGAVIPPIFATSTYKQDGVGGLRGGYEYSRSGNPTRTALEGNIAALEEGERGFAFASGLAAEHTLLAAVTKPGDHVVIPDDAYGGTYRLFAKVLEPWGMAYDPVPLSDPSAVRAAVVKERTRAIWVESPTNPLLNIADIAALAQIAHEAGALL